MDSGAGRTAVHGAAKSQPRLKHACAGRDYSTALINDPGSPQYWGWMGCPLVAIASHPSVYR